MIATKRIAIKDSRERLQLDKRRRWRQERERERRPMRCEILAKARAAKRR